MHFDVVYPTSSEQHDGTSRIRVSMIRFLIMTVHIWMTSATARLGAECSQKLRSIQWNHCVKNVTAGFTFYETWMYGTMVSLKSMWMEDKSCMYQTHQRRPTLKVVYLPFLNLWRFYLWFLINNQYSSFHLHLII